MKFLKWSYAFALGVMIMFDLLTRLPKVQKMMNKIDDIPLINVPPARPRSTDNKTRHLRIVGDN